MVKKEMLYQMQRYLFMLMVYLEEIKRIEVHEHAMSQPGAESIRIVLKPNREERLILPPGYIKDY
jgi:hypothetical protein